MGSLNWLEYLRDELKARNPEIEVRIESPENTDGAWGGIARLGPAALVVDWEPGRERAFISTPDDLAADWELHSEVRSASELLRTAAQYFERVVEQPESIREASLAQLRLAQRLTQSDVAKRLGIKQPAVQKRESNRNPRVQDLAADVAARGWVLRFIVEQPDGPSMELRLPPVEASSLARRSTGGEASLFSQIEARKAEYLEGLVGSVEERIRAGDAVTAAWSIPPLTHHLSSLTGEEWTQEYPGVQRCLANLFRETRAHREVVTNACISAVRSASKFADPLSIRLLISRAIDDGAASAGWGIDVDEAFWDEFAPLKAEELLVKYPEIWATIGKLVQKQMNGWSWPEGYVAELNASPYAELAWQLIHQLVIASTLPKFDLPFRLAPVGWEKVNEGMLRERLDIAFHNRTLYGQLEKAGKHPKRSAPLLTYGGYELMVSASFRETQVAELFSALGLSAAEAPPRIPGRDAIAAPRARLALKQLLEGARVCLPVNTDLGERFETFLKAVGFDDLNAVKWEDSHRDTLARILDHDGKDAVDLALLGNNAAHYLSECFPRRLSCIIELDKLRGPRPTAEQVPTQVHYIWLPGTERRVRESAVRTLEATWPSVCAFWQSLLGAKSRVEIQGEANQFLVKYLQQENARPFLEDVRGYVVRKFNKLMAEGEGLRGGFIATLEDLDEVLGAHNIVHGASTAGLHGRGKVAKDKTPRAATRALKRA